MITILGIYWAAKIHARKCDITTIDCAVHTAACQLVQLRLRVLWINDKNQVERICELQQVWIVSWWNCKCDSIKMSKRKEEINVNLAPKKVPKKTPNTLQKYFLSPNGKLWIVQSNVWKSVQLFRHIQSETNSRHKNCFNDKKNEWVWIFIEQWKFLYIF